MEKITYENFITDNKTNKVYLSSLIDKSSGALDMETRHKLKADILKFTSDCGLLYNTRDVWARDYMPIQLTEDTYLSYIYKPDYLTHFPQCVTNWQLHKVHVIGQQSKSEDSKFKVVQIPIILDGGNVIKAVVNGKPCIIMCSKVLNENNTTEKEFCDWWDTWWRDNFDGTEMQLILLPWEGIEDNPIGHADGMVRYIGNDRVLLTNYQDFDEVFQDDFGKSLIKVLEDAGLEVETLHYLDKFNYKENKLFRLLFKHTWCYINFLQIGNRILVPKLGYADLDNEALRQIQEAFKGNKQIVDVQLTDVDMTLIAEGMTINQNSGGALNCLTWTRYKPQR